MKLSLEGKKIIITGGARGIGAECVRVFLEEGASVSFCSRDGDELNERLEQFRRKFPDKVFAETIDISRPDEYREWLLKSAWQMNGIDIFIANASAGFDLYQEDWSKNFHTDLMGAVLGFKYTFPFLKKSSAAAMTIIASTSGLDKGPPSAYSTLKSALISYSGQLSYFAKPHAIRVNCLSPGRIIPSSSDMVDQLKEKHCGYPEDIANYVAFLSSPAARWINGINLVADGGDRSAIQF